MILIQNRTIEEDYNINNTVTLLQSNAENIMRKVDTSNLSDKDIFFLYKDSASQTFQVFTGTINESYKYINGNGDAVTDTGTYIETIYTRIFSLAQGDTFFGEPRQIIK